MPVCVGGVGGVCSRPGAACFAAPSSSSAPLLFFVAGCRVASSLPTQTHVMLNPGVTSPRWLQASLWRRHERLAGGRAARPLFRLGLRRPLAPRSSGDCIVPGRPVQPPRAAGPADPEPRPGGDRLPSPVKPVTLYLPHFCIGNAFGSVEVVCIDLIIMGFHLLRRCWTVFRSCRAGAAG